MPDSTSGSCLCGAVRFSLTGRKRSVIYCHCRQCRKTSGHFVAATAVAPDDLLMRESKCLAWYKSSANAERGFCNQCGSSLFWRPLHGGHVSVMAGSLDDDAGLNAREHIYMESAGDYYILGDGLPQYPQLSPESQ